MGSTSAHTGIQTQTRCRGNYNLFCLFRLKHCLFAKNPQFPPDWSKLYLLNEKYGIRGTHVLRTFPVTARAIPENAYQVYRGTGTRNSILMTKLSSDKILHTYVMVREVNSYMYAPVPVCKFVNL